MIQTYATRTAKQDGLSADDEPKGVDGLNTPPPSYILAETSVLSY